MVMIVMMTIMVVMMTMTTVSMPVAVALVCPDLCECGARPDDG
jgi:hypothetical protein